MGKRYQDNMWRDYLLNEVRLGEGVIGELKIEISDVRTRFIILEKACDGT
jgi:hypothetical protein